MSEADKMFEELGYKIDKNDEDIIIYYKEVSFEVVTNIIFSLNEKKIITNTVIESNRFNRIVSTSLNMQELKAIIKKCEELGWI